MVRGYHLSLTFILALLVSGGCHANRNDGEGAGGNQAVFWRNLGERCGQAYRGQVVVAPAGDTVVSGKNLVMHIRECSEREIRIPFHVGDNRSRTWVLTRSDSSLTLTHDHRHEDGSEESNTGYGGQTVDQGTAQRQEFPAAGLGEVDSPASSNVWTMELDPDRTFVYSFHRVGTDRRYRIEFNLAVPVAAPPPPWGR